jgi:hypothetical protein
LRFLRNNLNSVDFLVDSQSNDNDRWVVTAYGPKHPLSYFLFWSRRQVLSSLFSARQRPELAGYRLAPMQSHVVKARDGLDLASYLTLPAETQRSRPIEPLPMVIVHGGIWGRELPADRQGLCGVEPSDKRRNRGPRQIASTDCSNASSTLLWQRRLHNEAAGACIHDPEPA